MHKDKMDMQTASKLETKLPSHCSATRATPHHQQPTLLYKLLLLWEQELGRWDPHRDPAGQTTHGMKNLKLSLVPALSCDQKGPGKMPEVWGAPCCPCKAFQGK